MRGSLLDRGPYSFVQLQRTKLASEELEVHTRSFVGYTKLPRVQSLLLPLTAFERSERAAEHDEACVLVGSPISLSAMWAFLETELRISNGKRNGDDFLCRWTLVFLVSL